MRTTLLLLPLSLLLASCGMTAVNPGDDAGTDAGGCNCPSGPHATPTCNAGACGLTCDPHFADCDKNPQNGCEADTSSDGLNCGTCGKGCGVVANGTPSCKLGTCSAVCNVGFADCDNSFANGCETNTNTDKSNCGSCANSCGALANAMTTCSNGACAILGCDAGHADCDNKPLDGCEVTLADDPLNCGGCAKSCPKYPNATPVCMNGGCSRGPCTMGFDDCDNLPLNGCETSVASDLANCGACSKVCAAPHGTPQCMAGACTIAACDQGYADCDQQVQTGCEVQTAIDVANCGGCGKVCPIPANAAPSCANSVCGAACKFGFGDCDNNLNNGCEATLATDLSNCGQCGKVCGALPNASAGCSAGQCGIGMCMALFGNCDGNLQNGCEKNLANDTSNCGACGKACNFQNGQGSCLNGLCGLSSCNQGFADCDSNGANGCEAQLSTDSKNCGMCGKICMGGESCQNAVCSFNPTSCFAIKQANPNAANGMFMIDPDGIGPLPPVQVYCDMMAGGQTFYAVTHDWGEWGAKMTIVIRDLLAPAIGNNQAWQNACQLFGKASYVGGWKNNGGTYSQPMYKVYADSADWWTNYARKVFPTATYDQILILQDSFVPDCWAWYAEAGSLQSFGSPNGAGYAFCRGGSGAMERYHIYLCLP